MPPPDFQRRKRSLSSVIARLGFDLPCFVQYYEVGMEQLFVPHSPLLTTGEPCRTESVPSLPPG